MNREIFEYEIQTLELQSTHFDFDRIYSQVEQLQQKIKFASEINDLKKHEPVFLLKQSWENNDEQ